MTAAGAVLWTLCIAATSQAPQSQPTPSPPPTGLIVGRVVDGSSGRPIGGAIVSLGGAPFVPPGAPGDMPMASAQGPRAITNASGQFVFRKLAKGTYSLTATRTGYVDGAYGRRRPGGSMASLQLDDGQRDGDVVVSMWRYAAITGTVVDEAGEPLIGVQVRVFSRRLVAGRRRINIGPIATTDDRGAYRIANLMPGEYLVAFVWRESSLPTSAVDMRRNLPPNDPRVENLMQESIGVGSPFSAPGTSQAVQVGNLVRALGFSAPTPPPGANESAVFIYPTQFYPGVPSAARATVVTLASGQERQNIDFALRPAKTARVSGTLMGADGPAAYAGLRLVPAGDDALTDLETSTTMTGPAGEFTFLGVPAGQYTIKVLRLPRRPSSLNTNTMTTVQVGSSMVMGMSSPPGGVYTPPPVPDDPTFFAEAAVSVADRDVNDVVVTLQRGARVTGRFEFDGAAERPDAAALERIFVTLDRADGAPQVGVITPPGRGDASGRFKTYGVAPAQYTLRVGAPPGWTLKSALSEGRDVADQPIDLRTADIDVVITFTDRPTKLTGLVRGSDGNPDAAALVVVFPTDSAAWTVPFSRRIRMTRPSKTGSFTLTGLPSGDYYVAAIHEEAIADWQDPAVLEDLSRRAAQTRLGEGETRTQDVKTSDRGGR